MSDLFLRFVCQHPIVATAALATCPLLAMAIFGLMDMVKLELWDE